MPILHSIEALDKANIIDTQNRPVIVHASDLHFYYCKYHNYSGTAHRLFKEFFIASFLECWYFHQAPFRIVQVLPEHIPTDLTIPKNRFDTPCFGLQKLNDVFDLTKVTEDVLVSSRNRKAIKEDILKLAFFDIWTCNEDRHTANYNILYKLNAGLYHIYPIDHEACFNHQNLERGLVSIDYESSLIYSSFFSKLFITNEFSNQEALSQLKKSFYLYALCCRNNTSSYLQNLPVGWNVDLINKKAELEQFLLNDEWFETCWQTFLEFLQYFTT